MIVGFGESALLCRLLVDAICHCPRTLNTRHKVTAENDVRVRFTLSASNHERGWTLLPETAAQWFIGIDGYEHVSFIANLRSLFPHLPFSLNCGRLLGAKHKIVADKTLGIVDHVSAGLRIILRQSGDHDGEQNSDCQCAPHCEPPTFRARIVPKERDYTSLVAVEIWQYDDATTWDVDWARCAHNRRGGKPGHLQNRRLARSWEKRRQRNGAREPRCSLGVVQCKGTKVAAIFR